MKNIIVLIVLIALFFNCSSRKENRYSTPSVQKAIEDPEYAKNSRNLTVQKEEGDQIMKKSEETKDFRPKELKPTELTKEDIMGIWKADYDDGPNATLAIYEDSILNVEQHDYWVKNIRFSDFISEGAEQQVFIKDEKHVIKLNDTIYYASE